MIGSAHVNFFLIVIRIHKAFVSSTAASYMLFFTLALFLFANFAFMRKSEESKTYEPYFRTAGYTSCTLFSSDRWQVAIYDINLMENASSHSNSLTDSISWAGSALKVCPQ